MFLYQVTTINGEKVAKGQYNVICIYCSGEWPSKLRLLEHHHRGYINSPFYPNSTKCIQLHVYPNFKSPQDNKMLKKMLVYGKGSMDLPLKTQHEVDQKRDQIIMVGHKAIK
jgi:hypothetical protein